MKHEAVAIRGKHERDRQRLGVVQPLLQAITHRVTIVLRLDERDRDVRFVVEDDVRLLGVAAGDELTTHSDTPLVKKTSSRTCSIISQPACLTAGRMNFVQISRSVKERLSIRMLFPRIPP